MTISTIPASYEADSGRVRQGDEWTFMVYLDGDNDLEGAAVDDFLEMSSVGSSDDVNIVVQFDRIPGEDFSYGDWTDTRRGLVELGDVPDLSWGTSIGEANMGDPNTLTNFIATALAVAIAATITRATTPSTAVPAVSSTVAITKGWANMPSKLTSRAPMTRSSAPMMPTR